jgi:hypothetical protein
MGMAASRTTRTMPRAAAAMFKYFTSDELGYWILPAHWYMVLF